LWLWSYFSVTTTGFRISSRETWWIMSWCR
jgi:hypothetical protein